jgi:hypothetical protein
MPYDPSLDDQIFSKTYDQENTKLVVSIYAYNNGPKKLQITRENKDTHGNFRFTKLGRVSKEEITAILPLINEAIKSM